MVTIIRTVYTQEYASDSEANIGIMPVIEIPNLALAKSSLKTNQERVKIFIEKLQLDEQLPDAGIVESLADLDKQISFLIKKVRAEQKNKKERSI